MSNSQESTFDRKNLPDGKANPKYVDVLDEDAAIAGQKFTCMSFLSPEKILTKRELFLFDRFIEQWDFTKSMAKFGDFINFISYKYNLNVENLFQDYNEFSSHKFKVSGNPIKFNDVKDIRVAKKAPNLNQNKTEILKEFGINV